jgi:hypothetical protein
MREISALPHPASLRIVQGLTGHLVGEVDPQDRSRARCPRALGHDRHGRDQAAGPLPNLPAPQPTESMVCLTTRDTAESDRFWKRLPWTRSTSELRTSSTGGLPQAAEELGDVIHRFEGLDRADDRVDAR